MIGALLFALHVVALSGQDPSGRPVQPPVAKGTVRGRVVGPTGQALAHASVLIERAGTKQLVRNGTTDRLGRYEVADIPVGVYTVVADRGGYLASAYGQRRFHEPGTPVTVKANDAIEGIDIALPAMGRVTGRITDEFGEPLEDVHVVLMRPGYYEGRHQLVSGGVTASTNPLGEYTLNGVTPGVYYLFATLKDVWNITEDSRERTVAYASTYYPGTPNPSDARRIALEMGQQASNVDFAMLPGHAARVSGTAVDSRGRPLLGDTIYLAQEFRSADSIERFDYGGFAEVAADGTWIIKAIAPGDYKIRMHANIPGPNGNVTEDLGYALSVAGADVTGVALQTTAGWSANGTVTADGIAPPPFRGSQAQLEPDLISRDTDPHAGGDINRGTVNLDWTFTLTRVHGAARLKFTLPGGWMVKSITRDGRDITRVPLEGRSGEVLDNIAVVITNHLTQLTAVVNADDGRVVLDATAVVFPVDPTLWNDPDRYLRLGHPDAQGRISLSGLPVGDYYVAAVSYADPDNWQDPEYLQQLRQRAERVVLVEDQPASVSLKIQ